MIDEGVEEEEDVSEQEFCYNTPIPVDLEKMESALKA